MDFILEYVRNNVTLEKLELPQKFRLSSEISTILQTKTR